MSNVYDKIRDRVVDMLENGIIPWHRTYDGNCLPTSHLTGKVYGGMNRMLLKRGGHYWTWKQIQDAGGRVIKGRHAEQIYFRKMCNKKMTGKDEDGVDYEYNGCYYYLTSYMVFHETDIEGVPKSEPDLDITKNDGNVEEADRIITNYMQREGIPFNNEDCIPHYSHNDLLGIEEIAVPFKYRFDRLDDYYHTVFHEMVHSTGADHRLKRGMMSKFGTSEYAKEELVAEMGASRLAEHCNLEPTLYENAAAYCANWLGKLKNDIKWFVWAAGRADRAVDFILDIKEEMERESA